MVLILGAVLISAGAVSAADSSTDQNQIIDSQSLQPTINDTQNNTESSTPSQSTMDAAGAPVIHAYWVRYESYYLNNLNVGTLQSQGITDLFVLTSRNNPGGTLQPFISKFAGSGIRIHAWVCCFKDNNGNWVAAEDVNQQNYVRNSILNIVNNYAVDGIHLDYVRYGGKAMNHEGATDTITNFVASVKQLIQGSNKPNTLLSAALMPPCEDTVYLYGQDYGQLSQYLDFLVPMVYKGNFRADTNWIGVVTAKAVSKANGKPVVVGLQNYRSDWNLELLSDAEIQGDIKTAIDNGAAGYALFRYGPGKYVTSKVATPYKYVRYRGWVRYTVWVKKRIRIARGKYRTARVAVKRYKRGWISKWLYSYRTVGKWVLT
ncbi:MAG: glycosyl hydrolase family 18 protein [Methanobacteriaceae archaeon]|nr:glycosyl hydrolase family 18 protein [Methanobacteriaceae archaeon]